MFRRLPPAQVQGLLGPHLRGSGGPQRDVEFPPLRRREGLAPWQGLVRDGFPCGAAAGFLPCGFARVLFASGTAWRARFAGGGWGGPGAERRIGHNGISSNYIYIYIY